MEKYIARISKQTSVCALRNSSEDSWISEAEFFFFFFFVSAVSFNEIAEANPRSAF